MKRRSWLFVPGDSERKLGKIPESGADVAIVDLEDAVAPERKEAGRVIAVDFLGADRDESGPALWVRINALATGLAEEDLAAVVPAHPAGIVLPKPDSVADIWQVDGHLAQLEADHGLDRGSIQLLATATETALAVANLASYTHHPERLFGLTWGGEDLAAELGASTNKDENGEFALTYRLARSLCQLAAAAAGLPAVETLYGDFRDEQGLRRFAERARREGFVGMLAIHPVQVAVINAAFTPSAEEVEFARRVVEAFASQTGAGAVGLDGRMLDRPHLRQAQRVLELAAVSDTK